MDETCLNCEGTLQGPKPQSVPYDALPGVTLANVPVWTCADCGEEEYGIPRLNQLHQVLAHAVANRSGRLRPEEIRFLRKHLGWSGRDFATAFDVAPETVSRWENGERKMGSAAERLLRMCATRLEPITDYTDLQPLLSAPSASVENQPVVLTLDAESEWSSAA